MQKQIPPRQATRLDLPQPGYHFPGVSIHDASASPQATAATLRIPTIFDPTILGRRFVLENPSQNMSIAGDQRAAGRPTRTYLLLSNMTILSETAAFSNMMAANSVFERYIDIPPDGQMCISNRCAHVATLVV